MFVGRLEVTTPSAVKASDWQPVVEILGEVAIVVLELALCYQELVGTSEAASFPTPALFRYPKVALNSVRSPVDGVESLEKL